jgi:hypothetical protein
MANEEDEELRRLHKSDLSNEGTPTVLGFIVARQLMEYGESTVYLDAEGFVAVAAPGEIALDSLPEEMAITTLAAKEWTDEEIADYLKGRDARLSRG